MTSKKVEKTKQSIHIGIHSTESGILMDVRKDITTIRRYFEVTSNYYEIGSLPTWYLPMLKEAIDVAIEESEIL